MIGVAVLYTDPVQFEKLSADIRRSCGCEVQISGIDNRSGNFDLFSAYSLLEKELQTEIIVFCHQDICFHTENWGMLLKKYFSEDSSLGVVGVAGGSAHSRVPGGWMTAPPWCKRYVNIIQHFPEKEPILDRCLSTEKALYQVAVIDGVFMAFRHSVFDEVSFGRSGLTGYHGYDLDISLQLLRHGWKVAVSSEILLEHFSAGNYTPQYINNIVAIHRSNQDILPIFTESTPATAWALREYESRSLLFFVYIMHQSGIAAKEFRQIILDFWTKGTPFCKSSLLLLWEFLKGGK